MQIWVIWVKYPKFKRMQMNICFKIISEIAKATTISVFGRFTKSIVWIASSICLFPFCCAFSYVSSGHLDKIIHDYTDCISLAYLHHVISHTCVIRTLGCEHANLHWLHFFWFISPVLSSVSFNGQLEKIHSCTCCNWMVFRHYAFSNVGSKHF